ncbi:response regulator transcription factor [Bradyrhizobium sp. LMG 9283]|uniref:helix-turn-helix transcriptional regulator n=1 Tax=Bradyrhizobium sp. LMG 9283 TaxID=592064 RepID=UPI00388EABF5
MDQLMEVRVRENDRLGRIVSALRGGMILVDFQGHVTWMDDKTRRSVNGGLLDLTLPIRRPDASALDCFMSPVAVTINGQRTVLCAIQESAEQGDSERDLIAAIQAAMADTSWFARVIIEKLKSLRQGNRSSEASDDGIDALSDREREVLGLICEGISDAEMSRILRLSPNTVRNHIASLYRKIGVNRRSAAIIWARERGITGLNVVAPRRQRGPTTDGKGQSAE